MTFTDVFHDAFGSVTAPTGGGGYVDVPPPAPHGAWEVIVGGFTIGSILTNHVVTVGPGPVTFNRTQLRTDDDQRPLKHGMIAMRPDLLSTLQMNVPFTILAADGASAKTALMQLIGAWAPVARPVDAFVTDPAYNAYLLYGKPRDVAGIDESKIRSGQITGTLMFEATDPVLYSAVLHSAMANVNSAPGGFGFPFGFPFGFTASGAPVSALDNVGTAETWPTVIITAAGNLGDVSLTEDATGEQWAWGGTIPSGYSLVVDMRDGTVLLTADPVTLAGAVSVSDRVRRPLSDWMSLTPGTHVWRFEAATGSGTATVQWRDAFYR